MLLSVGDKKGEAVYDLTDYRLNREKKDQRLKDWEESAEAILLFNRISEIRKKAKASRGIKDRT